LYRDKYGDYIPAPLNKKSIEYKKYCETKRKRLVRFCNNLKSNKNKYNIFIEKRKKNQKGKHNHNGNKNPMYGKKHKKYVIKKMSETRKKWLEIHNHPMLGKKQTKRSNEKNRRNNIKYFLENPEKHSFYRLRWHRKTKIEMKMEKILKKMKLKYYYNPYFLTSTSFVFPDFMLKKYPIVIEVNGYYTHFTKEGIKKDEIRRNEFIKKGYNVLEFSYKEMENDNKIKEEIEDKIKEIERGE